MSKFLVLKESNQSLQSPIKNSRQLSFYNSVCKINVFFFLCNSNLKGNNKEPPEVSLSAFCLARQFIHVCNEFGPVPEWKRSLVYNACLHPFPTYERFECVRCQVHSLFRRIVQQNIYK